MKNIYIFIFIFSLLLINQINSFSLVNLLASQESLEENDNNDYDIEDVILKLKNFFDRYANNLKNKIKHVNKIILPREDNVK